MGGGRLSLPVSSPSLICTSEVLPCFYTKTAKSLFYLKSGSAATALSDPQKAPVRRKQLHLSVNLSDPQGFMKKLNEQKNEIKSCKSQSKTPVKPRVGLMTLSHEGNHNPVNLRDEMSTNRERSSVSCGPILSPKMPHFHTIRDDSV